MPLGGMPDEMPHDLPRFVGRNALWLRLVIHWFLSILHASA